VAQGVLGAEFIWGEDLNKIPGLTDKLTADITLIRDKGMRGAVETIMKQ
jgi:tagaturonate reductase